MTVRALPLAAIVWLGLGLAACSREQQPEPAANEAAAVPDAAATMSAAPVPAGNATPSAAAEAAATDIPAAMRGRWGLVPEDCTADAGLAKGLMTVSADSLRFYESVAKVQSVEESQAGRFKAAFAFSGEGETWNRTVELDLGPDGKTLVQRETGAEAPAETLTYTRC